MHASLLVVALTSSVLARAEEKWAGKVVFVTTAPIQLINGKTDAGGNQVPVATLDGLQYRVEDEDGDWIKVRQDGVAGWFPKASAVLASKAAAHFTKEIVANPEQAELYNRRSEAWQYQGDFDRSITDLAEAIRLRPMERAYFNNRGQAFLKKKNYDKAISDFNDALKLDVNYVRALEGRATAFSAKRDFARATSDYADAIVINPNRSSSLNNLAWLKATCEDDKCRDGKEAIKLAKKACELTAWKDAAALDTLAAAYAEAGQFPDAIKWMEEALKDKAAEKEFGAGFRARLQLYKDKKPYREHHDAS
jgi:tetratricopeptide (TPR) repeat protein